MCKNFYKVIIIIIIIKFYMKSKFMQFSKQSFLQLFMEQTKILVMQYSD